MALSLGMTIGKDVLGSTMNTLIFALFGGQLAFFLVSDLKYSFAQFLNTKVLVIEWITIILSATIITLTITITAFLILNTLKNTVESN